MMGYLTIESGVDIDLEESNDGLWQGCMIHSPASKPLSCHLGRFLARGMVPITRFDPVLAL